jgi:hypothetical protein
MEMYRNNLVKIAPWLMALGLAQASWGAPPSWGNDSSPSPTTGSGVSNRANEAANKGMYKDVMYENATKQGPKIIVLPGDIKSSNASFTTKFGPNNIADFAELELSKANFQVLERSDLGPMLNEIQLAYSSGDTDEAQKVMSKGKLKNTRWLVRFDVLKAEPVAAQKSGFNGGVAGSLLGMFGGSRAASAAGSVTGSVDTSAAASVWIIGMRYKILDATTTEQVATGYNELKMEVGAKSTSIAGISSGGEGGLTLDTMVQRLVQRDVYDIDAKNK